MEKFRELHHFAINGGDFERVKSLVEEGVDLEVYDANGFTPLLVAAFWERKAMVDLLIRSGANINCFDMEGRTVLYYAAQIGWTDTVQLLIEQGVELDCRDVYGTTPIQVAVSHKRRGVVYLLIKSGADIQCFRNNEMSLLHQVCRDGFDDTARMLIDRGANVHEKGPLGMTPLHLAASFNRNQVVYCLLQAGADWNFINEKGYSSFELLLQKDNIKTIRRCIAMGAFVDSETYRDLARVRDFRSKFLIKKKLCTQNFINKHNLADLPSVYELAGAAELPPIKQLRIQQGGEVAQEVKKAVHRQILTNGYCNLTETRPLILSVLCVTCLSDYIQLWRD